MASDAEAPKLDQVLGTKPVHQRHAPPQCGAALRRSRPRRLLRRDAFSLEGEGRGIRREQIVARMPTIVAMAYKYSIGEPFMNRRRDLSYSAILYKALGIPPSMFACVLALARTAGWMAQWEEMLSDPEYKIARPRQLYTGVGRRCLS